MYVHPPRECGVSTEDLECLGCGAKLNGLRPGQCVHVDEVRRKAAAAEVAERAEYERLKAKYEPKAVP
jgi:hypothetical protein